jgi:hypothetical protein
LETTAAPKDNSVGAPSPALWDSDDWRADTEAWIRDELMRHGRPAIGPVEEVKKWSLSCVLRAPTDDGPVYFKAAVDLPLFVDEPAITERLAALFPDHIPPVLSREPARRWMLLAEAGTPFHWNEPPSPEVQAEIFSHHARLQQETAGRVDELLSLGCKDRRLSVLASQVEPLVDVAATLPELTADEMTALRNAAPRLHGLCTELAAFRIPPTLVHGDLHLGNIASKQGKPVFFDWTDACITHPFLDMITVAFYEKDAELRTRLRDAYLSIWEAYEPRERLLAAWEMAKPLMALHQAVSYQYILAYGPPETQKELGRALPDWLRRTLACLETLEQA